MKAKATIDKELMILARSGKALLGYKSVIRTLKRGTPRVKAVILAENMPEERKKTIMYYAKLLEVPLLIYPSSSIELGRAYGRPHLISTLAVIDEGDSSILKMEDGTIEK
uniref:Ribosomal protein L30E n=1 Tax=uncultured korarchaeote TaxID=161241 RepID=A0A1L2JJX0_9CREN|nr:ribosomal protein L30E [uncultured korarchaeote]